MPRPRKPQSQEQPVGHQAGQVRLQPVRPDALNGRIAVASAPPYAYVLQQFNTARGEWEDVPTSLHT